MFPYTHICFARDVLGDVNNEIVLGAVFPDTVIAGFLQHADTHGRCGEIHTYLTRIGVFNSFAEAAVTHGTAPKGMDYFCDEKYLNFEKGYAFEQARPLVKKVIKCCRLPEEMGWWKSHNFIEMAADLWLYQRRRDCHGYLGRALDDRDLILALSQVLAPFYGTTVTKMNMSFPIYGEYVLIEEMTPVRMAEKYAKQMARKHDINIDIPGTAGVIEEALVLVDETFPEFLDNCRLEIGNLLRSLPDSEDNLNNNTAG
ncbi:MAG: hypothetical protein M1609_04735 [Firmicutes bacterium]|nr:hypothetical protein [Bacillota bacterium]